MVCSPHPVCQWLFNKVSHDLLSADCEGMMKIWICSENMFKGIRKGSYFFWSYSRGFPFNVKGCDITIKVIYNFGYQGDVHATGSQPY
jgi:hypothetical protein